jgi:5-enolpyruvylshikimate-3-phosphate synthase
MTDRADHPISSDDESHDRELNRHRGDEQRTVRAELVDRLNERGIEIRASESSEDVVDLYEAVEAFEAAVEARGGDLMVDTPPSHEPDDPRFVLPQRESGESLSALTLRIRGATDGIRSSRAD